MDQRMWVPSLLRQSLKFFGHGSQSGSKYIGTHNGKFHCDEVFACWMLKTLPQFRHHLILRTRNLADLETCDIVVDVGAVFDHEKKRYDHHQGTFDGTLNSISPLLQQHRVINTTLPYTTKLSSAGLIYAFYGKEVIKQLLNEKCGVLDISDQEIDMYYDLIYKEFVENIDAVDNGIKAHADDSKYVIPVTVQSLVEELNPAWNEKGVSEDARFVEAMDVVGNIFTRKLLYFYNSWMPCRNIVRDAILNREKVHSSGRIMLLPQCCPWKKHFFAFEKEFEIPNHLIYAIYPGDSAKTNWRVQPIPVSENTEFENRAPLPKEWRGKRDEELSNISGIKDAIFVHSTGFIGGAKSQEETIKMAAKALEISGLA